MTPGEPFDRVGESNQSAHVDVLAVTFDAVRACPVIIASGRACGGDISEEAGGRRQMCMKHYYRWKKYGDPNAGSTGQREATDWLDQVVSQPPAGCALWPFYRGTGGYPHIYNLGRMRAAHQVAWERLHDAPWPVGLEARHTCGRGADGCVNPLHIKPGTRRQNCDDAIRHGATLRGTRHPNAKLTPEAVRDIRLRIDTGESQRSIARSLDLHPATVNDIARGRRWGWLQ